MELVFATNNKNKIKEIKRVLHKHFDVKSMAEIGCHDDIPEPHPTLEGNALEKAQYIASRYSVNVFADDTGLEVAALDGAPGVYSARYAGPQCDANDNMNKLLQEMEGKEDRSACFRTVVALILDGKEHLFEGRVNGQILTEKRGGEGFGYDPIFMPDGFEVAYAEMDLDTKNSISHRGKAVRKLVAFLNEKQL